MIQGEVNPFDEAIISVAITGPTGEFAEIDAVIDTGFNDYLVLPTDIITRLGLEYIGPTKAELGNGNVVTFECYRVNVDWNGRQLNVIAIKTDGGPLVGMALMRGYELNVRVIDGGQVTIRPLN